MHPKSLQRGNMISPQIDLSFPNSRKVFRSAIRHFFDESFEEIPLEPGADGEAMKILKSILPKTGEFKINIDMSSRIRCHMSNKGMTVESARNRPSLISTLHDRTIPYR
jgi:hypothetical protein